ncbi:hypothetical protein D8674_030105 [Pyrus ussuriensis x Pyrus communis]|uniref:Uncharacterized protein n=1 Tax=Pyrus ussuriensis x Pyrus communis TaxID=2448454 RepID=A0A5N5EV23_9ROSA|nr:hypothetical protein D8674_030105 [Pyrus ussuriensis x Pyrus communis]
MMMMMMLKAQNFRQRSGLKMEIVFAADAVGGETIRAESRAGIAFELAIFLGRGGDDNEGVLGGTSRGGKTRTWTCCICKLKYPSSSSTPGHTLSK